MIEIQNYEDAAPWPCHLCGQTDRCVQFTFELDKASKPTITLCHSCQVEMVERLSGYKADFIEFLTRRPAKPETERSQHDAGAQPEEG